MRRTGKSFKFVYCIYLSLMVVLAIAAILYVRASLRQYRDSLPERCVEAQIEAFRDSASSGTFWDNYPFPYEEPGKFEEHLGVKARFAGLFAEDEVTYALKTGSVTETEQTYNILNGSDVIAEVTLRKLSEEKVKLFILNYSEWALKDVKLNIEPRDYRIDVPYDFHVTVNGVELGVEDRATVNGAPSGYEIKGLYLSPDISIKDRDGRQAEYRVSGSNIKVVLFDYSLTLPGTLKVTLDGVTHTGEPLPDGTVRHDIRVLTRPSVIISDLYGNTVTYEGGNALDLTYLTIRALGNYNITVDGVSVPDDAREVLKNEPLDAIRAFDPTVPEYIDFHIAVLKNNAAIEIKDAFGKTVDFDKEAAMIDLTLPDGKEIPDEIDAEVDVLGIAKTWSLFMTADLEGDSYGLDKIQEHLIKGSALYDSAVKWAKGVDITFTSNHKLGNPPFSEEVATNFTYLAENCFYVDVFLVKDMYVSGKLVPDTMNNRLYFIKYDGTVWKLAAMS